MGFSIFEHHQLKLTGLAKRQFIELRMIIPPYRICTAVFAKKGTMMATKICKDINQL